MSAGFVETSGQMLAVATSKGLFGYDKFSAADYNLTARTPDGTGSGWASRSYSELRLLDPPKLAAAAIDKAARSKNPVAIEPGKYTVVLEPAALADLLVSLAFAADARQADEGRSFFSKKGGGTRVGEQIVGEKVRLYSDPTYATAPVVPFDGQGLPLKKIVWVDGGVLKNLSYSRYWAQKQEKEATAQPGNLIMDGGNATMDDLIKGVERGILVTRFWYIRSLDPQTLLVTGLTRDGLFLIEKRQGHAADQEHALERQPDLCAEQPRRDDAAGAGRSAAKAPAASGFSVVCPGGPHPRVHLLERLGRRLTALTPFSASGSSLWPRSRRATAGTRPPRA